MLNNTYETKSVPNSKTMYSSVNLLSLDTLWNLWVNTMHPKSNIIDVRVLNAKEMRVEEMCVDEMTTVNLTKPEEVTQYPARGLQRSVGWKTQVLMWSLYFGGIPIFL